MSVPSGKFKAEKGLGYMMMEMMADKIRADTSLSETKKAEAIDTLFKSYHLATKVEAEPRINRKLEKGAQKKGAPLSKEEKLKLGQEALGKTVQVLTERVDGSRKCNNPTCDSSAPSSDRYTEMLKRCSRCRKVFYCGAACQKKDWPAHKKVCVIPTSKASTPASLEA